MFKISYLRISITEKCNLKCYYCRPDNSPFVYKKEYLTYEEIAKIVRVMTKFGLEKVRITGGEPLIRPNLDELIKLLSEIDGIKDISLTTNGITLSKHAESLKRAGLNRINISLDSLKPDKFFSITKGNIEDVLEGIKVAKKIGLEPVKVNIVAIKGVNDDEILDFVEFGKKYGVEIRFIEMMPIGAEQINWSLNKVRFLTEIKEKIEKHYGKLIPTFSIGSGAARVYKLPKFNVKIGFITPLSNPFCDGCSKLRLTAEGNIKLCLRTDEEIPVRDIVRNSSEKELEEFIKNVVILKEKSNQNIIKSGYQFSDCRRLMVSIGG
ncbi:MAG: GTP 3',8-cyclase MoaA [Persephonella sp.]|nr:MAG: GTP 3',8-cyclase MoaA [Persephonella sp.]RUM60525.1 MAG: GTP 3',8-cyclase MoaA [Persephonella sp.]